MEIKAVLHKPHTNKQRIDFIVENSHMLGYEIKETESDLEAWSYTEEEIAEQERIAKNAEIDRKIEELNQLSISDIREGNAENIQVYTDIINGLLASKY